MVDGDRLKPAKPLSDCGLIATREDLEDLVEHLNIQIHASQYPHAASINNIITDSHTTHHPPPHNLNFTRMIHESGGIMQLAAFCSQNNFLGSIGIILDCTTVRSLACFSYFLRPSIAS